MRILIFVPVSREGRAKEVVEDINNLDTKGHEIRVLFLVDDIRIKVDLTKYQTIIKYTGNYSVSEFDIYKRRLRIAENFNSASQRIEYIDTDYVFTFEDDCEIKPNVLQELVKTYEGIDGKIGFVSGVQAGRWSKKMIGVWQRNGAIIETEVMKDGVIEVGACGFYAYLTKKDVFCLVDYRAGLFGPDVFWGFDITDQGYKNYCNMGVKIGHKLNGGGIIYPDGTEQKLVFKTDSVEVGKITSQ